jgi:hypothetical protein
MNGNEPKRNNPFVVLAWTFGGVSVAIVAVIAAFAAQQLWVAAPIILALTVGFMVLGHMARKSG